MILALAALVLFAVFVFVFLSRGFGTTALPVMGREPIAQGGAENVAPPKLSLDEGVRQIATAITAFETGGDPGDPTTWKGRAKTNKNPGNLRAGKRAISKDDAGYAVYSSYLDGWSDLYDDIQGKLTGHTRTGLGPDSSLADLIAVYAPSSENPTASYLGFVSRQLDQDPSAPFSSWVDV